MSQKKDLLNLTAEDIRNYSSDEEDEENGNISASIMIEIIKKQQKGIYKHRVLLCDSEVNAWRKRGFEVIYDEGGMGNYDYYEITW